MLILVEGCDKSGKSSLIRELSKLLDFPVWKNQIKPDNSLASNKLINSIYLTAYTVVQASKQSMIFDRSHITEFVYARVLRNYDPLPGYLEVTNELVTRFYKNVLVIQMTAPTAVIRDRFVSDGETFVTAEQIDMIKEEYKILQESDLLNTLVLDSTNTMEYNIGLVLQELVKQSDGLK